MDKYIHCLRIQVCPKKGITLTFLFFSDGVGTQNILIDREGWEDSKGLGRETGIDVTSIFIVIESTK